MLPYSTNKLEKYFNNHLPAEWIRIKTIDAHTEGEPLRVIVGGYPEISGNTILEKRSFCKEHLDHIRTALMWEPRGHADMYGCIITPPVSDTAHFGVLFLHNEGYSTMCGHGIIGVTKVVLECGMFEIEAPVTEVRIDTPAGLVTAFARIENDTVNSVFFYNVRSFVYALDEFVDVPGIGNLKYDIAYGGAYYAFVNAEEADVACTPEDYGQLIVKGMAIKQAVMENSKIVHPFEQDLNFLYGTIFIGPPESEDADSRNVCIFAEGEVDRCPTGTGVSARMALHHARGEIKLHENMVIESIIGSRFTGSVVDTVKFGGYDAVIPRVEGNAYITGTHEFIFDPNDPQREGFILR